jgi:hypothetical protein
VDHLHRVVTRLVQCLIAVTLMAILGFSLRILLITETLPDLDKIVLCGVIGLSAIFVVLTLEFATTRIIKAIEAHPQAFATEIKSQRSDAKATKATH